jgi:hypothetical protein
MGALAIYEIKCKGKAMQYLIWPLDLRTNVGAMDNVFSSRLLLFARPNMDCRKVPTELFGGFAVVIRL